MTIAESLIASGLSSPRAAENAAFVTFTNRWSRDDSEELAGTR